MSKNMKYAEVRQIVFDRFKGKCAICGKKLALDEMCISLIIPKSKGGGKDFNNMQAACETCATMKNNLTQNKFMQKIYEIAKYHLPNMVKNQDNAISLVFWRGYQTGQEELKERIYKHFSKLLNGEKGGDSYDE